MSPPSPPWCQREKMPMRTVPGTEFGMPLPQHRRGSEVYRSAAAESLPAAASHLWTIQPWAKQTLPARITLSTGGLTAPRLDRSFAKESSEKKM